jgi:Tol biopolymer transport system component
MMFRTQLRAALVAVAAASLLAACDDNTAPETSTDFGTMDEDSELRLAVLANDFDEDGDVLSLSSAQAGPHAVRILSNQLIITPVRDFVGEFDVTYRAFDGNDSTAGSARIVVHPVDDAPWANTQYLSDVPSTGLDFDLEAGDADGDFLTFRIMTPPTAGTLEQVAGKTFRYRPTDETTTYDSFVYEASDWRVSARATVYLSRPLPNRAPVAFAGQTEITAGTASPLWFNSYDPDGSQLSIEIVTPPGHGTLGSITAQNAIYTPTAGYVGPDQFQFRASDGVLVSETMTYRLDVRLADRPPVATPQSITVAEDGVAPITLAATDPDGDSTSVFIHRYPSRGTLTGTPPSISYRPSPELSGPDSFEYEVQSRGLSAIATVTIDVTPVNDTPVAIGRSVNVTEDSSASFTLTGTDADSTALTFAIVGRPSHGTVTGTAPNLVYTPDRDFRSNDVMTFTVSDGSSTSTEASITFLVANVDDAPTARGSQLTTVEDTALTIALDATDVDGDALSFSIVTAPTLGVLVGSGSGVNYHPHTNATGTDRFTFRASDGRTAVTAEVTIAITGADDAPVGRDDIARTAVGTAISIDVLANDSDADGEALTVTNVSAPQHGSFDIVDGDVVYTPVASFSGTETVTYTVADDDADGSATTATAILRIGIGQFPSGVPAASLITTGASQWALPDTSQDGRFVVFETPASLVSRDSNGLADIYRIDRLTGDLVVVSVGNHGATADGNSTQPRMSGDGRYVVFASVATNLVAADTNAASDVFVRDLLLGSTTRLSVSSTGSQASGASQAPDISDDGQVVVFLSRAADLTGNDANDTFDIFVHTRADHRTARVSVTDAGGEADGWSSDPTISGNGRVVGFRSIATNLVAGDINTVVDVFVRDLAAGRTERVSVSSTGGEGNGASYAPSLSGDGRFVAFQSQASNLAPDASTTATKTLIRDRSNITTTFVHNATTGARSRPTPASWSWAATTPPASSATASSARPVPCTAATASARRWCRPTAPTRSA